MTFWLVSGLILIGLVVFLESSYTLRAAAREEEEYAARAQERLREGGLLE